MDARRRLAHIATVTTRFRRLLPAHHQNLRCDCVDHPHLLLQSRMLSQFVVQRGEQRAQCVASSDSCLED